MCAGILLICQFTPPLTLAQNAGYEVKGVVVDKSGMPILGATVVEKGTTNGVSTGIDGDYAIRAAGPESVIEVSYVGYKTVSLVASSSLLAHLTLEEDAMGIDDVVVIAYGVRKKGTGEKDRYRLVWEDVKYTPGTLKVVAKKDGKIWATDTVTTTGKPAALTLKPDRNEIKGDGYDLSYVTVAVRDAQGRMVPRSKNQLTFRVSGPADIAGICNGDPTDFTTMANPENKKIMKIKAFNGLAQVILRSRKGESGKVTLQVISNGLKPAQTTVTVK